jgi:hypothetical protein
MPATYPTIGHIDNTVLVVTRYENEQPISAQVRLDHQTLFWVSHLSRAVQDAYDNASERLLRQPAQHEYVGKEFRAIGDPLGLVYTVVAVTSAEGYAGKVVLFEDDNAAGFQALELSDFDEKYAQYEEVEVEVVVEYRVTEAWTVQAPPGANDSKLAHLVQEAMDEGREADDQDWNSAEFQGIIRAKRAR